jgi:hypothetical protein
MTNLPRAQGASARFDRRVIIRGIGAGIVSGGSIAALACDTAAQSASPSPAATTTIDPDRLLQLSQALVGGGTLSPDLLEPLQRVISADPASASGYTALIGLDPLTTESLAASTPEAQGFATNLLQFWLLGSWNDQPVEGRADIFFSLPVWQSLPYATQPTLCKAWGYWATDVV